MERCDAKNCAACPRRCALRAGETGLCGVRRFDGKEILCDNYGRITSLALDPIEKKPLSRFFPGTLILSAGSYGCNMRCPFCQNHEISMAGRGEAEAVFVSPGQLAERALELGRRGSIGVAYTYNEPLVGYEFVRDTARLVRAYGMKNVIVTNGCFSLDTLGEVLPWTDAMNIDLKGFTDRFYQKLGGDLGTVKAFIREAAGSCHVELTTLVVPGENDSGEEMEELAAWAASVDPGITLHVTRFFPRWRMRDRGATDVRLVHELAGLAGKYLRDVVTGNC